MSSDRLLRVYRGLLRLLPARFRARWGSDMEEVFRYRLDGASGPGGRAAVLLRGVVDLGVGGALEHLGGVRIQRGGGGMGGFGQDVRYAIRGLRSQRLLTGVAVGTLAVGIGAATATFSVFNTVLIKDLPYGDPDRLVAVWPEVNFNKAMAVESERLPALAAVSGMSGWTLTLIGEGPPLEIDGMLVSPHHFELLGVAPALGRTFRPDEELPGQADVVILSHDLWVRVFGADPDILGRVIDLAGAEYDRRTVVGVMPEGYREVVDDPDLWIPLEGDPTTPMEEDDSWYVNERVARLAPGATLAQANEQIDGFARAVRDRLPANYGEEDIATAEIQPLARFISDGFDDALIAALSAVALVLLIACTNVANLLIVRGESRSRDLAMRSALGAGRSRVARMLLAEGVLLGLGGGVLGLGLAHGLLRVMVAWAPPDFPRIEEVALDGTVLLFAVVVTGASTVLACLFPAVRASRTSFTEMIGGSSRGTGGRSHSRLSTALVGVEVALAVVVTVGSGLMLNSLGRLLSVDTGLEAAGVLTFRANPPGGRYPNGEAFRSYYEDVSARVGAVPGVSSVGAIHLLPGTTSSWSFPTFPEGVEIPEGAPTPSVNFRVTRPGYFETVRMPLIRGRYLADTDGADDEPVVLVNTSFVEEFWPAEDPIGRTVRIFSPTNTSHRVVGVVGDVRQHGRRRAPAPELYYAHDQVPWDQMAMWTMVRFDDGRALEHAEAVQAAVWSVDPDVPVTGMDELDAVFGRSAETTAFLAVLLSMFGGLSMALGAVGVFGVTAYLVGRRKPEFGVRIALGSSRNQVVRAGLSRVLVPVVLGIIAGLALSGTTSRLLESVLYEVEPRDIATLAAVAAALGTAALVAAIVPAWSASRVSPMTVLNND